MKEHMDRFPARLPPDLKRALAEKAEMLPGTSMNDLVVLGVRHVVEGADLVVSPLGVEDAHEDLVVGVIEGDVAPAKGIARHFVEVGQPRLGALLYFFAARMQSDEREAAKELIRSADQAMRKSRPIAKAMLEAALEGNPSSDVAKSRLGQIRYFDGDFAGAMDLLESVREDDNYAKLFYGWSALELAESAADLDLALDEIVIALRRWALGERSPLKRERWLLQLSKLRSRGPEFAEAVESLVEYANDNASWKSVDLSEVQPSPEVALNDLGPSDLDREG